ncbi:MAG: cyclase family protein [Saprospiraceae bacterium]|nr:MAG: metal-dependent hydrolase [Candidatus Parvibacillus calidus]MCC7149104.1 cyclase family protein [Saprospiraceae bacterium]WKZ61738.1 MAG: cyclase family protein [Saprospiraceae bacterium]
MNVETYNIEVSVTLNGQKYTADLHHPIDISMILHIGYPQVNCFQAPYFYASPHREGDLVKSIAQGGHANFYNVTIHPHGNGTHTQCVGHIVRDQYYINEYYKPDFHVAQLVSIFPQLSDNGDKVIHAEQLSQLWEAVGEEALIIRTLPNGPEKRKTEYTDTNPPYFSRDAIDLIVSRGIKHLLTDLPSLDREENQGKLEAYRAFWNYPDIDLRAGATVTELIFAENFVEDGLYLLNLHLLNIQLDVSPSRPFLYRLR